MGTVKYTGPVASFHCPTNAEIRSLKVHFSPKQLGEGDPSPENVRPIEGWDGVTVEQRGKNIWDEEWEVGYLNTSTGINATSQTQIRAKNYIKLLPNTTYSVATLTKGTIWACFFDLEKKIIKDYNPSNINRSANVFAISGKTFTTPNNGYYMRFYFTEAYGTEYKNDAMISIATNIDLYESYHGSITNYEFGVLGKNKFDKNTPIVYGQYNASGEYTDLATRIMTDFIPIKAGQQYTMKINSNQDRLAFINYNLFDKQYNWIGYRVTNNDPIKIAGKVEHTFSINLNAACYLRIVFRSIDDPAVDISNKTLANSDFQLELGSTATAYEPYNPNKTVYGGYVDLITGEVVTEWACINIPFDKTWNYSSSSYYLQDTNLPTIYCNLKDLIISHYKNTEISPTTSIYISSSKYWIFGETVAENLNLNSSEEINAWLKEQADNGTPVQICGTLASSAQTHYSLTPHQLTTFLGQNNVWSNADYVEVEYDLHETQDILARKQFIIANQPHIEEASGSIATFNTDISASLKECKVYFNPIQEGSGDPSPENVREINGWNRIRYANLTDLNIAYVRDNLSNTQGINYICNTTFYPHNIKIIGTAAANFSTPFMRCDNAIKNTTYYIYNLPDLDYNAWLCGIGTSRSQVLADPNVFTAMGVHGYPIVASSSGQLRIYFQALQGKTYNLDFYPIISQIAPIEINWQSRAGTIYGGYVDLIKGELVETYHKIILDGVTTNCKCNSDYSDNNYIIGGVVYLEPKGLNDNQFGSSRLFCNTMPLITPSNTAVNLPYIRTISAGQQYLRIYLANTIDHPELDTKQKRIDFVNVYLQENPITIIYPLREPIHYSLTPETLKTLRGTNNVWSNSNGDITVQFWRH